MAAYVISEVEFLDRERPLQDLAAEKAVQTQEVAGVTQW